MSNTTQNTMQALKTLVYGMGILIVLAILLLTYGFYTRITDPNSRLFKNDDESPPAEEAESSSLQGEIRVPLPEGCTIVEMHPYGQRLYLRTGPVGSCERVLIVDLSSGQLLGSLILAP
ncbi:MAG: hypothetical protein H6905_08005 [Hyphomicrobiales bacterium]|nr:hypothetical protein [Hyphomicrobiales bacterium]